ncbi:MAG: Ldh family oxidoreductase [Pseudomonadota bacterium]
MAETVLTLDDIEELAQNALLSAGASSENAASVARSTRLAERDGVRSHGLLYVPIYAEHVRCGKVDGQATPSVAQPRPGVVRIDAGSGFAHPAIDAGFDAFMAAARTNGVAVMNVYNSYNCGVLGHHAERIAEAGLLGLCTTNAPASIAPVGGRKAVIGTNPFAIAAPGGDSGATFVIDQSASIIARSEIMLRARQGEQIDPAWALDADGRPTADPAVALTGSMAPAGGPKGFGIGLMVELLAACLSGAVLGKDASSFASPAGGPPNTGQCFIAFEPVACSGGAFNARVTALVAAISEQEGARLPGSRRRSARTRILADGVRVDDALLAQIRALNAN